jgi:peptidoglycan/xylan/chitin deacetylase (PgdA/CDA1 family)
MHMPRIGQIARNLGRFVPLSALRALGRPAALAFHGVEHRTLDGAVQTNHHEAAIFEAMMRSLKARFQILPLSAIEDVLKAPERHSRTLFLTSDDGYANTLSVAADILEDLKLPWTLFVSTHHIDTRDAHPIFLLRLFFRFAPAGVYMLPHLEPFILDDSPRGRAAAAEEAILKLKKLRAEQADMVIAAMATRIGSTRLFDLRQQFTSEHFLHWEDVRTLSRRGVEIGAHGHRHWPLNDVQAADYLRAEAQTSRRRIEAEVGACRFFAYPYGNVGDVSAKAWQGVREAGFSHAFTTLSGSLDASRNAWLMPRLGIGAQDHHIASLVSLLAAGNPRLRRWQDSLVA